MLVNCFEKTTLTFSLNYNIIGTYSLRKEQVLVDICMAFLFFCSLHDQQRSLLKFIKLFDFFYLFNQCSRTRYNKYLEP